MLTEDDDGPPPPLLLLVVVVVVAAVGAWLVVAADGDGVSVLVHLLTLKPHTKSALHALPANSHIQHL